MFRTNECHLQPYLISNVKDLPKKHRKHLDKSWARVFYTEIFCRLRETRFLLNAVGVAVMRSARLKGLMPKLREAQERAEL
jgi:uncharacterized protein (UPF0218 family)